MRTETIEIFKFEELSKEAQKTTIEKLWDINVYHDWWGFTYEDAKNIGLEISGFNLERGETINTEMLWIGSEVAETIISDHGENCETFIIAKKHLELYKDLDKKYKEDEDLNDFEDEIFDLDSDFKEELQREFLEMLRREYEHFTSEEAIKETIIANDYEFLAEGGDIY